MMAIVVGGLLLVCLLYCLIAPNQYDASAEVALRTSPASPLSLESSQEPYVAASLLSSPVQQETLADVLRSGRLAWRVIGDLKLYQAAGFKGDFAQRFPGFRMESPGAEAQAWLLERFAWRLHVQTIPRTMMVRIRFRSRDAALSAAVVNGLIKAYADEDGEARMRATAQASVWLEGQLRDLKARMDRDDARLASFESAHGILSAPETLPNGQQGEAQHVAAIEEADALERELVAAAADRILHEAEYRAALQGDPELVVASDPRLQTEGGNFATSLLKQLHAQQSALEQEEAQLRIEHGPNFPRVVEIRGQLKDLERQVKAEDAKLVGSFRSAWKMAADREEMVRKSLQERTGEGTSLNQAATEYATMRQEADTSRELYVRVLEKVEEAGLSAGVHGSNIVVVDPARTPAKPAAPNLPLYMAIALFVGIWLAVGGALLMESQGWGAKGAAAVALILVLAAATGRGQAPTPSTSGLPTGVAHYPLSEDRRNVPNPKEAPAIWNGEESGQTGMPSMATALSATPMPAPIGPGDILEVSEFHTPEFRTQAHVAKDGTAMLPLIGEIRLQGLDETAAARAIEKALVAKGMLLHPAVSVLVVAYAGQDVSVLGEVARPGVYPYTMHHRLLDLISAASGLTPTAGRLVNIFHRGDPRTPHPVVLDPSGTESGGNHNPELDPGDTVQVSRAGLVYVIGDVVRPGGFPVDPAQGLTVVQALSLAWGPTRDAAATKALLIREQKGGRTLTRLNLKRLLHGQEPDQAIHDRDILFVPDSQAKSLLNRSMESMIQSTVGVAIYSALVYSQRY